MRSILIGINVSIIGVWVACGQPAFTVKPTATREDGRVKIAFAVAAPTDVAVYIENAAGDIVRHLAAGVLGPNAPEPLKPDTLEQTLVWDGKDDDGVQCSVFGVQTGATPSLNPEPRGLKPFRARVCLGLKAGYAGQAFAEKTGPNKIEGVMGLTAAPDGRLYVLDRCSAWVWGTSKVLVFRRDGSYEKTIKPFPSNLAVEKARAAHAFVGATGALNPLIHNVQSFAFYPAEDIPHQPAVTRNGQVVLAVRSGGKAAAARMTVLDGDGGIPGDTYTGPALGANLAYTTYPVLAAASDGGHVFVAGLGAGKAVNAIHSVKLPERGPAEIWFGDPATPGNDNTRLNDVRGLACDGKGRLFAADCGNNRVLVLNEKDKSVAGSFPVPAPGWLGVDERTGAVWVQSGEAVIKFDGWDKPKELARLDLPKQAPKAPAWRLALDASAAPAVLWAASGTRLDRYEELGAALSAAQPADCYPARNAHRPAADPTRREILSKWFIAEWSATVNILNEKTGTIRTVPGSTGKSGLAGIEGRTHRLGPDGSIYAQDHAGQAGGIIRFDRDGKPKPFAATLQDPFLKGRLPVGPTGTTNWERDFSVDRKNDIYVRASGPEYHGLMTVHVYDQEGKLKRIVLQTVSDGMYGPRVDPKGNLYILECVKPQGQLFPEEIKAALTGYPAAAGGYDWIYGSVVKFGPEGGAVWFSGGQASPLTYEGWGCGRSIANLRTTGGSLTGAIAKAPAALTFPGFRFDAAEHKTVTVRLKNDSDGTQATLSYHHLKEGYIESCGPGYSKTIEVKPNSDFTEYTFDMSGAKEWNGILWHLGLSPVNGAKGSFSLDWVRVGGAGSKLVWNFDAEDNRDTKLPATMKKEQIGAHNRKDGAVLQGAQWWKPGFSPVGDLGVHNGCHCTGTDFDVDDFGRTFAPDTGRFRVGVLDTAGNEILSFGAYGNQDNCGPDSYVVDPATKVLRARKEGDPKDLASPAATPEIAFGWIVGLAVTDRYAYVDDVINKRILRVALGYAAQETCDIK